MKRTIVSVCLMICLLAGSFAAWKLYGYYRIYDDGKKEYDKLTDYIEKNKYDSQNDDHSGKEGNKKAKCPVKVDFDELEIQRKNTMFASDNVLDYNLTYQTIS